MHNQLSCIDLTVVSEAQILIDLYTTLSWDFRCFLQSCQLSRNTNLKYVRNYTLLLQSFLTQIFAYKPSVLSPVSFDAILVEVA